MSHISAFHRVRKAWHSALGAVALFSAAAFANLCLADSASGDHKKVVGVTLVSLQSPYLIIVVDAMKVEAAKQDIDLIFLDSARSVATESSQIESLIAKKVDLIVMNPVDQKTSQAAAKLINNAGIPLILLDARFTDDFTFGGGKFVAYVGSEDTVAGEIQGQYLADKLPEGGNVVYLVIEYGLSATARRKAGFESVIKDHPNLTIVTEIQGLSSRAKGKTIMEKLLHKYSKGQLQALVAQNDEVAIGASSAIQAADRLGEFKVHIGVNGLRPALDAIAAGTLSATVFQDPVGQGTQVVTAASKILAGEAVAPQVLIPFKLVTKENVSSFK